MICFILFFIATVASSAAPEFSFSEFNNDLSEDTLVRKTRATAGKDYICVPTATCATSGNTIDPRIVTPGQSTRPVCKAGTVACKGNPAAAQCGTRQIPASQVNTNDGPTTYGAFPWQAYITNNTGYGGSGVLLDRYHVLTTAHKVYLNRATPENLKVYMGVHNPTSFNTAQLRTVSSIKINSKFNPKILINDIAILRLSTAVELGYQINIGTACLPPVGASYVGRRCIVSGWGKTNFNQNYKPRAPQKQVTVPIVGYSKCRASMSKPNILGSNVDKYLTQRELCAGGEANRDACTEDGGSPLVCQNGAGKFIVVGLVIWGKNCGRPGVYGVYVDVSKYRNWINSNIRK